jgi:hypothetical protein
MWIIDFLPAWIFYATLVLGIVGIGLSYFLGAIPIINNYKLPLQIVSIFTAVISVWYIGGNTVEEKWLARVKELELKVAEAEVKSGKVNTVIQEKVVTKVKVVREKVEVVKREIQIQKEIINADCKLSDTAIDLYNKAVSEPTEDKRVGDTK